jgi:CRISPR/Cas system-associated exonuclease Cas4 (RecB family)
MSPNEEPAGPENLWADADLVSASELKQFVYCERAWFLDRQGKPVSSEAQAERKLGAEFHHRSSELDSMRKEVEQGIGHFF